MNREKIAQLTIRTPASKVEYNRLVKWLRKVEGDISKLDLETIKKDYSPVCHWSLMK